MSIWIIYLISRSEIQFLLIFIRRNVNLRYCRFFHGPKSIQIELPAIVDCCLVCGEHHTTGIFSSTLFLRQTTDRRYNNWDRRIGEYRSNRHTNSNLLLGRIRCGTSASCWHISFTLIRFVAAQSQLKLLPRMLDHQLNEFRMAAIEVQKQRTVSEIPKIVFFRIAFQTLSGNVQLSNENCCWSFIFVLRPANIDRLKSKEFSVNYRQMWEVFIHSFSTLGMFDAMRCINNNVFLKTSPFKSHSLLNTLSRTSVIVNNVFIKLFKVENMEYEWTAERRSLRIVVRETHCLIHKYLTNKFPV